MIDWPSHSFGASGKNQVMEPLRWLTNRLLKASGDDKCSSSSSVPPLTCDLATLRFSPFFVVLQYYSTLLSDFDGHLSRIMLLYRSGGHQTFEDWHRAAPREVDFAMRAIILASSWVYERHLKLSQQFPWAFTCLVDGRLSVEEKLQFLDMRFMSKRPCCLRPGMAKKLRAPPTTPSS